MTSKLNKLVDTADVISIFCAHFSNNQHCSPKHTKIIYAPRAPNHSPLTLLATRPFTLIGELTKQNITHDDSPY